MRLTVGAITAASRALIAIFTAMSCIGVIYASRSAWLAELLSNFSLLFIESAIFTLIAFIAFPKMRRGDVANGVICLGICLELVYFDLGNKIDILHLASVIVGAYVVFLSSFLERLRTTSRSDPQELFSLAYKGDRRRSRTRSAADVKRPLTAPELS